VSSRDPEDDRDDDPGEERWDRYEYECAEDPEGRRWPLTWRHLYPRERWLWWEQLWTDAVALRARYRLSLRSGWWEDEVQVEALAALAAWTQRYDSGEWDDPPGKLSLLYDLERVSALLRDGSDPFHADRDRLAFALHLIDIGCQPPPGRQAPHSGGPPS
jgi:hypothetical protein